MLPGWRRGWLRRLSPSESSSRSADGAGEEPAAQRRVRHEPHAELAAGLDVALLGVARPERVLDLERDDGVDFPGPANGCGTGLGKPDVAGLPLFHEPRHGAHRLLHRNRGVDAGHAVDVQAVDAQPLEAFLTGLDQVLGRAAAVEAGAGGGPRAAGLGVDHHLVAPPLDGLADELVVVAVAVAGGGVEEIDAELEGPVQRRDGLVVVAGSVHPGHAQAAEPHG